MRKMQHMLDRKGDFAMVDFFRAVCYNQGDGSYSHQNEKRR